jgi:nucleotide-binding universal stress UspA family protein
MKFKRMLCPVDFSEISATALRTAGRLATALASDLTVLHAQRWEFPLYFTAAQIQELETQLRKSDQAAQKYFEDFVARNLPGEAPRSYRFVEEEPVAAILRAAGEIAADLIVMGTHGRTGWNRFRLGSVMEGVLRQVVVPVLAVGPGASSANGAAAVRDILCPVDFDALSKTTLEAAVFLARETGARLTVLHVLEREPEAEDSLKAAEERLCEWVRVEGKEQCALRHVVRHGHAVQAIVDEAKRISCDLLVIGAKPRPRLRSIMFGTTTESLIRTAPCPVLVAGVAKVDRERGFAGKGSREEQQL